MRPAATAAPEAGNASASPELDVSALRVTAVEGDGEAKAFLDLPARLAPLGWGVPLRWEEARLFDPNQPFTTYVNDLGTPVVP